MTTPVRRRALINPWTVAGSQLIYWVVGLTLYAVSPTAVPGLEPGKRQVATAILLYAAGSSVGIAVTQLLLRRRHDRARAVAVSHSDGARLGLVLMGLGISIEAIHFHFFLSAPLFQGDATRFNETSVTGFLSVWPILVSIGVALIVARNTTRIAVIAVLAAAVASLLSGDRTVPVVVCGMAAISLARRTSSPTRAVVALIAVVALALGVEAYRLTDTYGGSGNLRQHLVDNGLWHGTVPSSLLLDTAQETTESQLVAFGVRAGHRFPVGVGDIWQDWMTPFPGHQEDLGARTVTMYDAAGIQVQTSRPGGILGTSLLLFGLRGVAPVGLVLGCLLAFLFWLFQRNAPAGTLLWPFVAASALIASYGIGLPQAYQLLVVIPLAVIASTGRPARKGS